ncbi:hypothetical protein K2173_005689 [Erythroxylum novogranatense]|uniref:RRM domain-containing protein n=1 Tax=Erythroxylum novogranatense TaxID=1862640 RepID=A0AAV8SQP7_9ROSI|nr:hypothetical protein K2173_005689 [Erythroxylum novogranatense]
MAASTIASTPLHTKLSNASFTRSPVSVSTKFLSNSFCKPVKPLKLHNQKSNLLSLPSLPNFRCTLSTVDNSEATQDDNFSFQDDPEVETGVYEQEAVNEEEQLKPTVSDEDGKLYVGNLPYSMNSDQLAEVFQEAGRVINVEVIYDRVTDRSRGFGFVTMGSVEEAKEAIKMLNGSQVGGRTVRVNFPEVPKGGEREVMRPRIRSSYQGFTDTPHKIYAGNLGWGVTSQSLRDAFADQPGLLSAKVIYEKDTGRSRGFGFLSFQTAEAAEAAINAMNGEEVEGRPLRLNLAAERARLPTTEATSENDLESSELLSGIGY